MSKNNKKKKRKLEFDEVNQNLLREAYSALDRIYLNLCVKNLNETKEEYVIFDLRNQIKNMIKGEV